MIASSVVLMRHNSALLQPNADLSGAAAAPPYSVGAFAAERNRYTASTRRGSLRNIPVLIAFLLQAACSSNVSPTWHRGERYSLGIAVTGRGLLVPELRDALRPSADSLIFSLSVDSVRADSAFGRWCGDLRALGISPRGVPVTSAMPFVASFESDSIFINMFPGLIDAQFYLIGRHQGADVAGTFNDVSPHVVGTFRITPAATKNAEARKGSEECCAGCAGALR